MDSDGQSDGPNDPIYKRILNDREIVMDIRDCFAIGSELIPVKDALGRVSGEIQYKCPPGFPILIHGEKIQESHLKLFEPE